MKIECNAGKSIISQTALKFGCALALFAGLMSLAHAQSPLPFYEPFPSTYTEGEALGGTTSGTVWTTGNSASSSGATIRQVAAMAYPGLTTQPTNTSRGLRGGTGTGKNRGATFTPTITNGTIYASFLFSVQTNMGAVAGPRLFAGLSSGTGTGPTVDAGIYIDTSGHLLVGKNAPLAATSLPASPMTYSLVPSNTYLVVLRYTFKAGNSTNDAVDLWVDPATIGNNSSVPAPSITMTNGTDTSGAFQSFYYFSASSGLNTPFPFFMDEIRVGTNWADVVPTNSVAGNIYNFSGGGTGCPGDAYGLTLSGSDNGVTYLLYTNGVYSGISAAGTGSSILFGPESATAVYTVLATNTTTAGVSWMNGSATINVFQPPAVITNSLSVVAATNSTVVYSVTTSGSGLGYQWYLNGTGLTDGSRISGSQTALLTISPVLASDAATTTTGYYCVITNNCGSKVISPTNGLTIQLAGNLIWQGTPTNTWDIATTLNWTNSAGTAVVFNTGDNVTFDDTFQNPLAIIASPYLSPGTITVSSSQAITFSGTGNIFGMNSLLNAIGTGTLTISNANSFGGGTLISNETVQIRNYGALGSGAVNLAGGSLGTATLHIPMTGSASSGLYNNLAVMTDSILQFDGTGTYGCVLFGSLTGNPGTTLTVNHSGSGPDRLRIYGTNFTCNANINLNSSGIQLAPYNELGTQVYNGVISGSGSLITRNGNATIVLNNANTYTGGTTLSLGTVGIGSDSASDGSSGPFGTTGTALLLDTTPTTNIFTLYAVGGAHTIGYNLNYLSALTNETVLVISGSNALTFSGQIDISSQDGSPNPTNRTIQTDNTAPTIFTGSIVDGNPSGCGIIKTGNGTLYLNGANTYSGLTTVSNGVLSGSGSITGPIQVQSAGSIGAGSPTAIGTLTVNNNLTLSGNGFFRLNKSLAQSNDLVVVSGVLTNTAAGIITVSNQGPALVIGDTFTLFSQAVSNGAAMTITGGGMNWTNRLAVDGSIQALSVASPIANYPTNISYSVSGNTLAIHWPATHLGWNLQSQTNALSKGLGTSWVTIPGTSAVTSTNLTIIPANPTVFYRLSKP